MMLLVLGEWWTALAGIEKVFWGISIVFSVLFFIQFVLSLIGLDFETDFDVEVETDTGFSTDVGFTILSVRSFIAFFTFFGWGGILAIGNGGSLFWTISFGLIAGFSAMFVVAYTMYFFFKMQDDGSVFNPYEAIDEIGTVYLRIPANKQGTGKIQIKLQGAIKEIDAITAEMEIIPTGTSVRVVDVVDDKVMLVEPVDKYMNI